MSYRTELIPLGTASAIPAHGRHLAGCALRRGGRVLLFDCGEGTQYRLLEAGVKRSRIEAIFLTHFHGDHLYGLPGILTTMALLERTDPLTLVGPAGLQGILESLPGLKNGWLPFDVDYVELGEGFGHAVVYETEDFTVEARPIDHRVFAAGFRFAERARPGRVDAERAAALGVAGPDIGRLVRGEAVTTADGRTVEPAEVVGPERPGAVFAYVLDTAPCPGGRALADGADLLLHEATFTEAHAERAAETGHSTARQAAEVARDAGAKRLLLTHFSARYETSDALVAEARAVFQNTDAARELETVRLVPGEERG
ncbi:MAG: ribonuclease Z [Bacteroidota bacterium]